MIRISFFGNKTFHDSQHDFRAGHTTISAQTNLIGTALSNIYNGNFTVSINLDHSKEFVLVDHAVLIEKRDKMAFVKAVATSFDLICPCVQTTSVNERGCANKILSTTRLINKRVPRGLFMGLIIFLVFFNGLPLIAECNVTIYSDDINLFVDAGI